MGGTGNLPVPVGNLPTVMTTANDCQRVATGKNVRNRLPPRLAAGRNWQVARPTQIQIDLRPFSGIYKNGLGGVFICGIKEMNQPYELE